MSNQYIVHTNNGNEVIINHYYIQDHMTIETHFKNDIYFGICTGKIPIAKYDFAENYQSISEKYIAEIDYKIDFWETDNNTISIEIPKVTYETEINMINRVSFTFGGSGNSGLGNAASGNTGFTASGSSASGSSASGNTGFGSSGFGSSGFGISEARHATLERTPVKRLVTVEKIYLVQYKKKSLSAEIELKNEKDKNHKLKLRLLEMENEQLETIKKLNKIIEIMKESNVKNNITDAP